MARRVFFSFHYEEDVARAMVVRNAWVTKGIEEAGYIDKAEFEKIKLKGKSAVEQWIDQQLNGTSVTVVLIGRETLKRPFVQYEICQSINKGNGLIGIHICNIKDMKTQITSLMGDTHTVIGNNKGLPVYFDDACDAIYDYINDDGYNRIGAWIENSAKKHGK